MRIVLQFAGLLILAASTGLCHPGDGVASENPPAATQSGGGGEATESAARSASGGGVANANRINNPLNPAQRFLNMTPEEQERVLEKANPQQRERLLAARERWQAMPPAARQRLAQQFQSVARLPAEKQVLLFKQIAALNRLADGRRGPVGAELRRLLRMPAEQRQSRFASEEFADSFSAEEQQILKDLSTTLPDDYPLAGR